MAQTNLVNSLFKIDAAEGLVRYTNTVKPFHSKLLDVLIEYIYKEDIKVKVTEKFHMDIQQFHTTGGVTWDATVGAFVATGSACYFQVINASSTVTPAAGGKFDHTWVIEGHHSEKFTAGSRFVVTFADASSKIFIVAAAVNSQGFATTITTLPTTAAYTPTATTIQLAITPDYRIIGANVGDNGAWIVDGDQRDQFQVGENIIIGGTDPSSIDGTVYTISALPEIGVIPNTTVIPVTERVFQQPLTVTVASFSALPQPPSQSSTTSNNVVFVTTDTGKAYHWRSVRYVEVLPELAYFRAMGTGTLRIIPKVFNQIVEPITDIIGAVWVNPVTNVSKRYVAPAATQYVGTQLTTTHWIHNYTRTNYSWSDNVSPPGRLIIETSNAGTNSFLVKTGPAFEPHTFTTISTKSNELMFSTPYTIVGVDPVINKWIVSGIISSDDLIPGESIYISASTSYQGLGQYIVSEINAGTAPNTTDIHVTKQISRLAVGNGVLAIPAKTSVLPQWVEGTRVSLFTSGTLPNPLLTSQPYFFVPIIKPFHGVDENGDTVETPATFALSTTRKPRGYDDYVDITTFGSGILSITQDETYVPGTKITVRDSFNNRNDGSYTILQTSKESSARERIYVTEKVRQTTPPGQPHDGVMEYDLDSHLFSGLTEKTCTTRDQSGLHASATVTELLEFTFSIEEFDFVQTRLAENEPRNEFLRELGFDIPQYDESGFDGAIVATSNITPMWGSSAYAHSMMQIGFDTQYFDMGGIDETTQSVAKKYGKPGR